MIRHLPLLAAALLLHSLPACDRDDEPMPEVEALVQSSALPMTLVGPASAITARTAVLPSQAFWIGFGSSVDGELDYLYRSVYGPNGQWATQTIQSELPKADGRLITLKTGVLSYTNSDGFSSVSSSTFFPNNGEAYRVDVCAEDSVACGALGFSPTDRGLLILGREYTQGTSPLQLRWLSDDARADVKVSNLPDSTDFGIFGVTTFGDQVFGVYRTQRYLPARSVFTAFRFSVLDPAASFSTSPPFEVAMLPYFREGHTLGHADATTFTAFGGEWDPKILSWDWQTWTNHRVKDLPDLRRVTQRSRQLRRAQCRRQTGHGGLRPDRRLRPAGVLPTDPRRFPAF